MLRIDFVCYVWIVTKIIICRKLTSFEYNCFTVPVQSCAKHEFVLGEKSAII
jgi:hypothetical protein